VPMAQQALTKFLELPAVPIGSYVSSPVSLLHWLDPRVKQAWLAALLLFPPNGTPEEKVGVCVALALATATALPTRVWRPQLTTLTSLCVILFAFMVVGADSVMPVIQPREPPAAAEGLLVVPQLEYAYRYVLIHIGPLQVTRRGVNLAVSSSCLTFTVLQSAHLTLCTTTPEAMASGIRWYLRPLAVFRAPVDEIVFTLLLSLRFTAIVFEEVRNISLGLAARGVDWRALGWRGTISLFSSLLSRTLESLFSTSSAVADAVTARGYKGAARHRFFTPADSARAKRVPAILNRSGDLAAMLALCIFVARFTNFEGF
jgi:energy-coupling factor transporter transmembrane protein EcfT